MAKQLVGAMTAEFDPAQYKDEYREALQQIIEAKVDGQETVEIEAPEEGGKLIDLMAALEASVNAAKAARDAGTEAPVSVAEAREAKEAKAAKAARAARATKPPRRRREGQGRRRGRRGRRTRTRPRKTCGPQAQVRLGLAAPGRRARATLPGGRRVSSADLR